MVLNEKIKEARKKKELSQEALAQQLGVSRRSILYYESGSRTPSEQVLQKLCEVLDEPYDFFVSIEDNFILNAANSFGSRGKKQAEHLINEANALFAGGELNQGDKELFLKAMEKIYTESKERAKKYTPKKYRNEE